MLNASEQVSESLRKLLELRTVRLWVVEAQNKELAQHVGELESLVVEFRGDATAKRGEALAAQREAGRALEVAEEARRLCSQMAEVLREVAALQSTHDGDEAERAGRQVRAALAAYGARGWT